MRNILILLTACCAALPAQAQQTRLSIARGEEVIAVLSGDAASVTIESRTATTPNGAEAGKGTEFARGDHDDAMGANFKMLDHDPAAPPPPILDGKLRIRFVAVAGKDDGSMLSVQNGYDQALAYRATIAVRGKSQPTDVCIVLPQRGGFEHWPYPIEKIEMHDLRFESWQTGDPVRCE